MEALQRIKERREEYAVPVAVVVVVVSSTWPEMRVEGRRVPLMQYRHHAEHDRRSGFINSGQESHEKHEKNKARQ